VLAAAVAPIAARPDGGKGCAAASAATTRRHATGMPE